MSSLEVFEIKTNGTCLLCLAKCKSAPPGDGNNTSAKAFKLLLRYLRVDIFKLIQFSKDTLELMEGFENLELRVTLCGGCSTMATDFLQLFKDFEKIRLGLDMFADMMQTQIEDGAKVESRVKEYRRLVISSRSPINFMNASLAESLRKDIVEKCALRLRNSVPSVSINQVKTDLEMATRKDKVNRSTKQVSSPVDMEMEPDSVGEGDIHVQDQDDIGEPMDTDIPAEDSENLSDRLNGFRRHAIMKSEQVVGCTLCNKFFRNGSSLSTHLLTVHTRQVFGDKLPPHVSEEDLASVIRDLLDKRTKFTDGRKHPSGCPICQKGFQNQFWLRRHILTFHFDKILANLKFKNEGPSYKASKVVSLVQKRKPNHRRGVDASKDRPYQCKYCVTSFTNLGSLKTHLQATHTIHTQAHKLPPGTTEAQLTAVMNSLLASRRNIRNDLLHPCGCPLCPRKFGNGSKLRVHLCRCHMDAISKNVQKSTGPKPRSQLKVANNLSSAATSTATGKNSLCKCIICGKRFLNQFYLKSHHAKEHSSSKPNPQQAAPAPRKEAVQPQRQGQHAAAPGSGSGSHQCVPCNRFFTQISSLHFHQMTTHPLTTFSDQLPIGITEEELKNALEIVVQRRRRTLGKGNNSKISECPHCTRYFHHLSQLRAHILQAHMDQVRGILEVELENENELVEINPLTECEVLIKEENEEEPGLPMEALWMSGNANSSSNSNFHENNDDAAALNDEDENNVTLPFTIPATTPRTPQQCQCSICGENFPHRRSLGDHRRKVHNASTQREEHPCDHCGKVFGRFDSLRAHILTTHTFEELRRQNQIPAGTTEDIFKEGFEGLLDEGKVDPSYERGGKKYDCVVCNKSYKERWELRLHLARYHMDRIVSKLETLINAQPSDFSELPFAYNWGQDQGEPEIIDVEDEDEPAVQILDVRGGGGEISDEQLEEADPLYPE